MALSGPGYSAPSYYWGESLWTARDLAAFGIMTTSEAGKPPRVDLTVMAVPLHGCFHVESAGHAPGTNAER